jgi:organic radical activating enzyme
VTYQVVDGKIESNSCELNVAHHCNLTCRGCIHLSPWMKRQYADPKVVLDDLSKMARYYRPKRLTLLGGEPLLHPAIQDVISAVRESGITDYITVTTNGVLLSKMADSFWDAVDEVKVSSYPGKEMPEDKYKQCIELAQTHNVVLKMRHYRHFQESYSAVGTENRALIRRIYQSCQMAHTWHCNTVDSGYFYKCPPALFIPKLLHLEAAGEYAEDRIPISDGADFAGELLRYLNSPEPLKACTNCLGTVGASFPHVLQPRSVDPPARPTEELVDWGYLRVQERAPILAHPLFILRTGINWRDMLTYVRTRRLIRSSSRGRATRTP